MYSHTWKENKYPILFSCAPNQNNLTSFILETLKNPHCSWSSKSKQILKINRICLFSNLLILAKYWLTTCTNSLVFVHVQTLNHMYKLSRDLNSLVMQRSGEFYRNDLKKYIICNESHSDNMWPFSRFKHISLRENLFKHIILGSFSSVLETALILLRGNE